MYGTAPRMGFFVPIFVDSFPFSSTRGAKHHNHPPYRHPPTPSASRASGNPCAHGERFPTHPDTCFPQTRGTTCT